MHARSKAVLKTTLQVEQSSRIHGVADVDIIDICVMLGSVRSPTSGTVEDYIINFTVAIKYHLERGDIYQIFDRAYIVNSIQQMTRSSQSDNDAIRKHQLSRHTTLPVQNVALKSVHNQVELINLINHYPINH